jgi:hypothetical protein
VIVCAAESKTLLDVAMLRSGAIVVDASTPRCFDTEAAVRRTWDRGDVLFTEGGLLQASAPFVKIAFVPDVATQFRDNLVGRFTRRGAQITTAGALAALFAAADGVGEKSGDAARVDAKRYWTRLRELDFTAAAPQLEDQSTPASIVAAFRERFGAGQGWTPLIEMANDAAVASRKAAEKIERRS